jgi:hypothetical protein
MTLEITYEQLAERSGTPIGQLKETEMTTTTKRQRRLAEFDWTQFQRSMFLNGPTAIALTFVDYLDIKNRYGGARGSGGPSGERNGNFRHGYFTTESVAERARGGPTDEKDFRLSLLTSPAVGWMSD